MMQITTFIINEKMNSGYSLDVSQWGVSTECHNNYLFEGK